MAIGSLDKNGGLTVAYRMFKRELFTSQPACLHFPKRFSFDGDLHSNPPNFITCSMRELFTIHENWMIICIQPKNWKADIADERNSVAVSILKTLAKIMFSVKCSTTLRRNLLEKAQKALTGDIIFRLYQLSKWKLHWKHHLSSF